MIETGSTPDATEADSILPPVDRLAKTIEQIDALVGRKRQPQHDESGAFIRAAAGLGADSFNVDLPNDQGGTSAKKAAANGAAKAPKGQRQRRPRGSSVIMGLLQSCHFWHGRDGEAYATWRNDDHFENAAVRSSEFKRWVCYAVFKKTQDPPSSPWKTP